MFVSVAENSYEEVKARESAREGLRSFGISFLDDALIGIGPGDLVLLGAPSGAGKTQLCCNIALANVRAGRRVHMIALEADRFEIERRIKYQIIAREYFGMHVKPSIGGKLTYDRWALGDFLPYLADLEVKAMEEMHANLRNLFVLYKSKDFGMNELIETIVGNSDQSDLFLVDHAHYFDFDDDNENRAMKALAKTVRGLAIDENRPIILVAHLRKRDKGNPELVAGLDEFHGSSDLTKIATRVVTIAPGQMTDTGKFETFFRVPKNRLNGGSTRFIARMLFNPQKGSYENEYRLGPSTLTRDSGFQDIPSANAPEWATHMARAKVGGDDYFAPQREWSDQD